MTVDNLCDQAGHLVTSDGFPVSICVWKLPYDYPGKGKAFYLARAESSLRIGLHGAPALYTGGPDSKWLTFHGYPVGLSDLGDLNH